MGEIISIIIAIIGIVIGLVGLLFGDEIRDWYAIRQKSSAKGDGTVTNANVKTDGPLSYKNRPIVIHNTGRIDKIEFKEDQKEDVSATPIDPSTMVVVQKKPVEGGLFISVVGSGTTTISGSTSTTAPPPEKKD